MELCSQEFLSPVQFSLLNRILPLLFLPILAGQQPLAAQTDIDEGHFLHILAQLSSLENQKGSNSFDAFFS